MGPDSVMHFIDTIGALLFVDVLLSGDNAMVIALACRNLPAQERRRAMMMGTAGAIGLRIALTAVAGVLLRVPLLKIIGGVLLLVIAIKLLLDESGDADTVSDDATAPDLWSAVTTVITADVIMSLDNVVGLAAVAQGDVAMLSLGLLISMPLLMFGSSFLNTLMLRWPLLIPLGCAMLGWIGGDIAMSDALIAETVNTQSPGLTVVVPALAAVFVLLQARIIRGTAPSLQDMRLRLVRARPQPRLVTVPAEPEQQPAEVGHGASAPPPAAVADVPDMAADTVVDAVAQGHAHAAGIGGRQGDARAQAQGMPRQWPIIRDALGVAAVIGAISTAVHFWMPKPSQPKTYFCAGGQIQLQFHEGNARVKFSVGAAYANASLQPDGSLTWGEQRAVSTALNMAPPTQLVVKDPQTLVITGGDVENLTCVAPAQH